MRIFDFPSGSSIPVSNWGMWSGWSDCSRTCGKSGVRSRHRICQIPPKSEQRILCEVGEQLKGALLPTIGAFL